ncbi:DUF7255 family protein [Flexithrix dorotheae]|uniref:DUF7255 family protein n=1 Tax=Flexithrix dorotheae TaxID=70993 RepID=UPI00037EF107|nr:hypothetical protein [Flexithrix dorotheae]
MSFKAENLREILLEHYKFPIDPLPKVSWKQLKKSPYLAMIKYVYEELGGTGDMQEIQPPQWQLEFEGLAVELDEQLHFNKYRRTSLRSQVYDDYKSVSVNNYRTFCRKFDKECLKSGLSGSNWTDSFAEKHFGKAEERGDLGGNGSPKWKLRAFQDFLKDVSARILPIRFIRIAIWEEIMINRQLVKVNQILTMPTEDTRKALFQHIERKIKILEAQ